MKSKKPHETFYEFRERLKRNMEPAPPIPTNFVNYLDDALDSIAEIDDDNVFSPVVFTLCIDDFLDDPEDQYSSPFLSTAFGGREWDK